MKEEYLKLMAEAGFLDIRIMDETSFPIECIANDPTAKAIIVELEMPIEKAKEVAGSVTSIKVRGVKPK